MTNPGDYSARQQALDINRSFIVKAPAGSGKTTLLVKRYLKLLTVVNQPEEIIAITFTRKAAGELVSRVMSALVQEPATDSDEFIDDELMEIAKLARQRDQLKDWQLTSHPSRIRIQTIDSLCNFLVRQMPWSAGFGAAPSAVSDDLSDLYRSAARQSVYKALSTQAYKTSAGNLLASLDNDFSKATELIMSMLAKRDQWHNLISGHTGENARQLLQANWTYVAEHILENCARLIIPADQEELLVLGQYAAIKLIENEIQSPICAFKNLSEFPKAKVDAMSAWKAITTILLTTNAAFRKSANIKIGFPPLNKGGDENKKKRFVELLSRLNEKQLHLTLAQIAAMPETAYSDTQWQLLESLIELLRLAQIHLLDEFQKQARCDHIEIANRAVLALGHSRGPSDLALRLDYAIKHILVDEFQDTSQAQMQLFNRLTAGWQGDDERTVFFVGDPMQSIYRFRQADVGLFLKIFNHGFENTQIKPLTLTTNFRSSKMIVDWVNQIFTQIFPHRDDMQFGAVRYVDSTAHKTEVPKFSDVVAHMTNRKSEAVEICQLIQHIKQQTPDASIAVLVRGRSHLVDITVQLQHTDLKYQGIKIEPLKNRSSIQDVLALTRALVHFGDKLSWLALLRAPWCGLSLPDLTLIAQQAKNSTVWQVMNTPPEQLSDAAISRLDRLVDVLAPIMGCVGRQPLHHLVARAWHGLCGPDTVHRSELGNLKTYFNLLGQIQQAGNLTDLSQLENALDDLWAASGDQDCNLQLMTMHSAKGLEFDVVILPGLARKSRPEESKLLIWKEFVIDESSCALLVSPLKNIDESRYAFIQGLDKLSQREEIKRLLYVACTRAKNQLHLFLEQTTTNTAAAEKKPGSTLQSFLEPLLYLDEASMPLAVNESDHEDTQQLKTQYQRLPLNHQSIPYEVSLGVLFDEYSDDLVEYEWAGVNARHEGTLIHEVICQMARGQIPGLENNTKNNQKRWHQQLLGLGVQSQDIKKSIEKIRLAITNMANNPKAQWILDKNHNDSRNEWPVTGVVNGKLENIIIDRTFIDEKGNRWIIDYKTSTHDGADVSLFIDSEYQRYRAQLEKYAALLRLSESAPIKLGLYFPLLNGWREWNYVG